MVLLISVIFRQIFVNVRQQDHSVVDFGLFVDYLSPLLYSQGIFRLYLASDDAVNDLTKLIDFLSKDRFVICFLVSRIIRYSGFIFGCGWL